jgi:hypothetical protein
MGQGRQSQNGPQPVAGPHKIVALERPFAVPVLRLYLSPAWLQERETSTSRDS